MKILCAKGVCNSFSNVKRKSHRSPIKTFTIKCTGDQGRLKKRRPRRFPTLSSGGILFIRRYRSYFYNALDLTNGNGGPGTGEIFISIGHGSGATTFALIQQPLTNGVV